MNSSWGIVALCLLSVSASGALIGRSPATLNGTDYQAYYDDVLDVTWVADASLAQTSGFDADGLMAWPAAFANWPASLNNGSYLGVNDWRLPGVAEYGAMYSQNQVTTGSPSPFSNMQAAYWSSTAYRCLLVQFCTGGYGQQQSFDFSTGAAEQPLPDTELSVWAVRSGDIAVVPIPAAVWLFSAALGLMGVVRRKTGS